MNVADLNDKIIRFCRRLRTEGLEVSQADTLSAIQAIKHIFMLDRDAFYFALRAVLCFSPEEYKPFDRVFRGFWGSETVYAGQEKRIEHEEHRSKGEDQESDVIELNEHSRPSSVNDVPSSTNSDESLLLEQLDQEIDHSSKIAAYSSEEKLMMREFKAHSSLHSSDLEYQLRILLRLLKQALATDLMKNGNRQIHFKKTIRKNIQYGGKEFFKLYKAGRSRQNNQLLITLADISGSMELYFRVYLPLLYWLHRYAGRAEMILFNTTIYPQTRSFRLSFHQMLDSLNQHLHMSAKGTKLGQSLKQFNKQYQNYLSPKLTTVLIFSDGWDRGDVELLREELSWLSKHSFQIIWLNPLLGSKGYTPLTQAFETSIPYITHMVSAHDYKSLYN